MRRGAAVLLLVLCAVLQSAAAWDGPELYQHSFHEVFLRWIERPGVTQYTVQFMDVETGDHNTVYVTDTNGALVSVDPGALVIVRVCAPVLQTCTGDTVMQVSLPENFSGLHVEVLSSTTAHAYWMKENDGDMDHLELFDTETGEWEIRAVTVNDNAKLQIRESSHVAMVRVVFPSGHSTPPLAVNTPAYVFDDSVHHRTVVAVEDTYTTSRLPTSNYGEEKLVIVGNAPGAAHEHTGLIKFDVSSLEELPEISYAQLRIHRPPSDPFIAVYPQGELTVFETAGPWDESTVTESTRPPIEHTSEKVATALMHSFLGRDEVVVPLYGQTLPIGEVIRRWIGGENHGLSITAGPDAEVWFSSREGGNPVLLDVAYVPEVQLALLDQERHTEFLRGAEPSECTVCESRQYVCGAVGDEMWDASPAIVEHVASFSTDFERNFIHRAHVSLWGKWPANTELTVTLNGEYVGTIRDMAGKDNCGECSSVSMTSPVYSRAAGGIPTLGSSVVVVIRGDEDFCVTSVMVSVEYASRALEPLPGGSKQEDVEQVEEDVDAVVIEEEAVKEAAAMNDEQLGPGAEEHVGGEYGEYAQEEDPVDAGEDGAPGGNLTPGKGADVDGEGANSGGIVPHDPEDSLALALQCASDLSLCAVDAKVVAVQSIDPVEVVLTSNERPIGVLRVPNGAQSLSATGSEQQLHIQRALPRTGPAPLHSDKVVSASVEIEKRGRARSLQRVELAGAVELCLHVPYELRGERMCLGFVDERVSPPQWRCESNAVVEEALDIDVRSKNVLACGSTSHFTQFAVLIIGKSDGGGGVYGITHSSVGDIVLVLGVVVTTALIFSMIALGVIRIPALRRIVWGKEGMRVKHMRDLSKSADTSSSGSSASNSLDSLDSVEMESHEVRSVPQSPRMTVPTSDMRLRTPMRTPGREVDVEFSVDV